MAARGFLREGEVGPELSGLSGVQSHPGSPQRLDLAWKEALEPRLLGRLNSEGAFRSTKLRRSVNAVSWECGARFQPDSHVLRALGRRVAP